MAEYSELIRRAQEVRNEVKAGANTASRVGLVMEDTIKAVDNLDKVVARNKEEVDYNFQRIDENTDALEKAILQNTANIEKGSNAISNLTPKTFTEAEKEALEAQGLWESEVLKYPLVYVVES